MSSNLHFVVWNSVRFVNNKVSYMKLRWNWTNIKRKYCTKQRKNIIFWFSFSIYFYMYAVESSGQCLLLIESNDKTSKKEEDSNNSYSYSFSFSFSKPAKPKRGRWRRREESSSTNIRLSTPYYNLVRHTASNNLYSKLVRSSIFGRLPSVAILIVHTFQLLWIFFYLLDIFIRVFFFIFIYIYSVAPATSLLPLFLFRFSFSISSCV